MERSTCDSFEPDLAEKRKGEPADVLLKNGVIGEK